jgi:serine/threonine-protein kinase
MSPEQLSGDKLDGRSDLYSLALVFYRMLSGKLPFEATTVQETMIKRLTDEPIKLAEVRPDLSFPAGLQPVLDTALARTPAERYQSVAKFAADVGAITGRPGTSSVPHTRSGTADTEGKTQLLHPSAATGPTTRISAKHPAPRTRSFVPAAVGLVVVLAGGGAWVVLSGGNKANGTPSDSVAVSHDTAKLGGRTDTMSRGNRQGGHTTPPAAAPSGPPAPPPILSAGIDPARASDILDALIESTPAVIRDSAAKVYYTAGVSSGNRAFAACMVAQAEQTLGNQNTAVQWANRGLAINSQLKSCQNVIQGGGS